jgi:uncharacterized protein YjbK
MMQELEIERKNLLTKDEYNRLITGLSLTDVTPENQRNHYFETADFQLKQTGSALRIREKNGQYVLTLKEPQGDGLLETHAVLTQEEAHQLIAHNGVIKPTIATRIKALGVSVEALMFGGTLETNRIEVNQDDVLVVLDESHYLDHVDYELEVEGPSLKVTEKRLAALLARFSITKKDTPNKIARFYKALNNVS